MNYLVLKAFHLIFVVCWFAGLFYLGRLFIYFKEAELKKNSEKKILQDQYFIMAKRLMNIIIWPSVILTSIFGWYMIFQNFNLLDNTWMQVKLIMVAFLILYVIFCQIILNQMSLGTILVSENKLRFWNEIPTLFLVSIIFLATLKTQISWVYALGYLTLFSFVLIILIKLYSKFYLKK